MIKILNLYAGIGGNRKLWPNDKIEVTAVEYNKDIANIYHDFFPNDKVIITDAHQYLLEHYKEYDFIWSSPPCPTHSRTNTFLNAQGIIRYPDMTLWQEIIFLRHWFKGIYCIENVISYYEPLIKPQLIERHYFWSNFLIENMKSKRDFNLLNARESTRHHYSLKLLQEWTGFNLDNINIKNKLKILRNCVNPKLGLHIFNCAFNQQQMSML